MSATTQETVLSEGREDGTVALSYNDTRSDVPDDAELTTDVWFRHSHDGGATWTEEHLGGPFDLLSVRGPTFQHPALGGGTPWIGHQQGLEAAPEGFVTAFTMGASRAEVGASDIFFSRIRTVSEAADACRRSPPSTRRFPWSSSNPD